MRQKTREAVERVQEDRPGVLDEARTLGRALDPELRKRAGAMPALSASVPGRRSARQDLPVAELPVELPPRPPGGLRDRAAIWKESGKEVRGPSYVPDLSRQTLTLSQLLGQAVVATPAVEPGAMADVAALSAAAGEADAAELPELIDLGMSYSPVMEQVQAQLDAAIARAQQSRSELLPRASARRSLGPEHSLTTTGENRHRTYATTLRLTQPLVNLPAVGAWASDLSARTAAQWRLEASRESVALAITKAVVNLAAMRVLLEFSDMHLAQFGDLQTYLEVRTRAGAASQVDLERTRTRVLAARQQRIEQQAAYRSAQLELERFTGQVPARLRLPYLNQLQGLPGTREEIRSLVRDASYDLRALRADIEAQRRSTVTEYTRLLPVVGVSVERDISKNVRGTNAEQTDTRYLLVASWDLALGGRDFFAGRSAQAELAQREARLREETTRALQAADAEYAQLQAATLRLTVGRSEEAAARDVVAATAEQLKSGRLGSLLEVLDAHERLFSARQRLVSALRDQMLAQAQLLGRIGRLASAHLFERP